MVIVDDISLQKFSNYHNAYLLLLISWVVVPPWLSINYNSLNNQFGNITPTFVVVLIILIGLYSLALSLAWNRYSESETALKAKCISCS
jgi:hypothetical protein